MRSLTGPQRLACDTSGDGQVDVDDAVLILQYVVGLTTRFPAAQNCNSDWAFMPQPVMVPNEVKVFPMLSRNSCQGGALSFEPLAASVTDQDFLGRVVRRLHRRLAARRRGSWAGGHPGQGASGAAACRAPKPHPARAAVRQRHAALPRAPGGRAV